MITLGKTDDLDNIDNLKYNILVYKILSSDFLFWIKLFRVPLIIRLRPFLTRHLYLE